MMHAHTPSIRWSSVASLALALLLPVTAAAQIPTTERDSWQRVDAIFAALQVSEGDRMADVGAGSGFFSFRLSRAVGPAGRVFAEDIDAGALAAVRETARREGLENIETIVGDADDPKLPDGSLDGVLIVNAYHEMREHEAMLAGIRRALRPGGRLVIVDMPPTDSTSSRSAQTAQHDIAMGIVAGDLSAAGFEIVQQEPDFVRSGRHRNWLIAAVRPDTDGP